MLLRLRQIAIIINVCNYVHDANHWDLTYFDSESYFLLAESINDHCKCSLRISHNYPAALGISHWAKAARHVDAQCKEDVDLNDL